MCRCNRNDLPVRPISHLWTVRAARQIGGYLRRVGSWRGDIEVCGYVVEKESVIHVNSVESGKCTGGDSAVMIVAV